MEKNCEFWWASKEVYIILEENGANKYWFFHYCNNIEIYEILI